MDERINTVYIASLHPPIPYQSTQLHQQQRKPTQIEMIQQFNWVATSYMPMIGLKFEILFLNSANYISSV